MIYRIEITETLSKIVEIEADSFNEALNKAKENYAESFDEYVLSADDWQDTEFKEWK